MNHIRVEAGVAWGRGGGGRGSCCMMIIHKSIKADGLVINYGEGGYKMEKSKLFVPPPPLKTG